MRSLILSFIFIAFSLVSFGQASETCLAAEGSPTTLVLPHTETITIDPTWTLDVDYIPPVSPTGLLSVAYWSFDIVTPGYHSIDFQTTAGATITSDVSIGISDGTISACPMDGTEEIYSGMLMVGSTVTGGCTFLAAGTYTMAFAVNQGMEGDIEVIIASNPGASNTTCGTALGLSAGTTLGDNTCSSGLVWYSFTVVNGGSVSIGVSDSGTPNAISAPEISEANIIGCGSPDGGTTSWTCLPPGTVIYFAAGDGTAPIEQGDFNVNIIDDATGLPNEICSQVAGAPVATPSCVTTTLTDITNNTTVGACQETIDFGTCGVFNMEGTVWFAFTTDANAQTVDISLTNGSISDATFVLIDGTAGCPAGNATLGGCQSTGMLVGEVVMPSTTYYIAVATDVGGTDGDFTLTVTPQNPPANDLCAGAEIIPAPSVTGVEGTTTCASSDPSDFCTGATPLSEDHVVYYTYTVDPAIMTNRNVTITVTGSALGMNSPATSIGLGVWTDCAGTAYMNTPTSGNLCDALAAPILYECVAPGTMLTIAVASADMMEGDFNILITEMETGEATNDVCDIAMNPDITSVTAGTNFCANGEGTFCGMSSMADHQVWYTYTNTTMGNVDLGVTFTSTGTATSATDLSMVVLVGDCMNVLFPGTTDMDYCSILDAGEQIIGCIEAGETISILVGSAEDPSVLGPEGDFTIGTNVMTNSPANDECDAPEDITASLVTCMYVPITVDNTNACPEDFALGGCDFNLNATVWYSFTVPNNGLTHTLEIQNINAGSYLGIWDQAGIDCDAPGAFAINSDCESGAGPHGAAYTDLVNGNTYLIGFANPIEDVAHSFEIKLNELPSNDECANADAITPGMLTWDGTTSCATQPMGGEYSSGACPSPDDETNTVFYTYEVPAGDKGFHVTITATAMGGFTGDVNLVVFEDDPVGTCATGVGATSVEDDVCTTTAVLVNEYECVGEGTYVIRVSTSDANAGDFQIMITPINLVQPNDFCDSPDTSLDPGLDCTWQIAMANTIGACPEDPSLDPGNTCALSADNATVWYQVTAPATATFLDLQINTDGGSNPFLAVFPGNPADCDMQTFVPMSSCYEGLFTDLVTSGNTTIPVTPGAIYLIAAGVSDPAGAMFEFGIKWITPPPNDDCLVMGLGTGAEALTAGMATDGTTACATQPIGGEYASGVCTPDDQTNTVFYTYEVPDTEKGFHVTITADATNGNPLMGDINLVVFEDDPAGSCATGVGATAVEEVCTISTAINDEFECIGPGTYVIRVSTSSANEGDFQITITPILLEQPNDNCDFADVLEFAPPLECEWMVIDADTEGACPEDMNLDGFNCGMDDYPVTWYEAMAPANAEFLDLQINFGGITPFIGIFEQGLDCDNLSYVGGSSCYSGTFDNLNDIVPPQPLIDITPGATYLIAIGTDIDAGGLINFGIKWITPPDNDDCADAEVFMPVTPGADPGTFTQTLVLETTQCATEMFPLVGTACDDNNTNTVWYTYTVEMDVKEITIDVTNYTPTNGGVANFSIYVSGDLTLSDACPDGGGNITLLNQADGTPATYCGGEGTDLITLSCIDEGTVIAFSITSSSDNEGTFDVTLNTAVPNCTYTNDECVNASALTGNPDPLITDDPVDCVLVAGCNDLACAEMPYDMPCGITALNTVFYTFMTDAVVDPVDGAFVNIEILNGEAGELDSPGAVLFDGNCTTAIIGACAGVGGLGTFNSGPLGGPGMILPNTTYTIMIYNSDPDQNGGTFDLCVTVTSGCVNDDICDAFTLDPGVTVDNPASSNGCTDDFVITTCDNTLNMATLWYQVDVPVGTASITITLNNQIAPDGVEGEVSIAVGQLIDCNNFDPNDFLYEDCTGFGTGVHEIPCVVEYGTYWIQIGSDDEMEAGDFTIEYNFNTDPDPMNDLCSTAEDLVVSEICEFVTFPGTLKDACPELFDLGACEYSVNQAVWYTITIPGGPPTVTDMDIEIEGLANPMIGVFEFDCMNAGDPAFNNGIINSTMNADGTVDCSQMPLTEGIIVTPGNTYHILVSTSTMEDIAFDISIKLNAPPINDDPCINSDNPPYDLTGGGSHLGTTCCARGPKDTDPDLSAADWENQAPCNNATEDAAVWYMFTPDPADDGYDIIVEGGSVMNQMTVQVYAVANPANPCTVQPAGDEVIASSCVDLSTFLRINNCDPSLTIFVKVSTADLDCGDFTITVTPAAVCEYADECDELTESYESVTPATCSDSKTIIAIPGCLDLACPEDFNNCSADQGPTVWFEINIDSPNATVLTTQVDAPGFDVIWQVFEGTSCADLAPVTDSEIIDGMLEQYPCSDSDGEPVDNFNTPINPFAIDNGLSYFIAVTAIGDIDDPNFTLNFSTGLGCLACSGDSDIDCGNGTFNAAVLEDGVWVDVPDDFQFCQGIDVEVCFEFIYDTEGSGNDWLHGFVPVFGPGWDVDDAILASLSPLGNFEFFSSEGACAPILNGYDLPNVCTYMEDGVLKLCNTSCNLSCPCSGGMESGDPLPSGFWYNTPGGSSTCGDFGCSPASFYGWPGGVDLTVEVCMTLKTKEFDTEEECEEDKSLQIIIQTFSDAISGCWEDSNPCIVDPSLQGPAWEVECEVPPAVEGPDDEICNQGQTDIFVETVDGSSNTIIVEVEDNPNVNGEMNHTFTGGTGTIQDDLTNLSDQIQIVIYNVYSEDPTLPCPGPVNQIEVIIYPDLMVVIPPADVCDGDCTTLIPDIFGGAGAPYTYVWGEGQTTASIEVCPTTQTEYSVTVTDVLGCTGEASVLVTVNPPVELLLPPSIAVCKDDSYDPFNPDYMVCLTFLSGEPFFVVDWVTEAGLNGDPTGISGECFAINEVTSSEFLGANGDGVYVLTANVTDANGCMESISMEVIITGELTVIANPFPYECGETTTQLNVTGFDAVLNNVDNFYLYGGCPDDGFGDLLEEAIDVDGMWNFPIDLLAYTCYTVVGQTASGCQTSIDIIIPLSEGTPIQISGTPAICIGDDATITVDNDADYLTYEWTPNIGNSASVTFTPDSTASYIVETTDSEGCIATEIFEVVVNPLPTISLAGALEFCENGVATITASGGVDYAWTGVAGPTVGPEYTTGVEGNATVTVTDANGCVSDSTITFVQVNVIEIIIADADICDGMGDTLFVPNNIINVVWEDDTPNTISTDSFFVVTGPGSFTVSGIDAATGCDALGAFTIAEFNTPIISAPDTVEVCRLDSGIDSLCINFTTLVTGSTGTWNQDGIIPDFDFNSFPLDDVCFEDIQTGCYPFTFTTNSAQTPPCMDVQATVMVCVNACPCPSPATEPIPDICNLGSIDLDNSVLTSDPGTWSVTSGPTGQDIASLISGTIFDASGILPGPYVVTFTLDNPGGGQCISSSDQTIMVSEQLEFQVLNTGILCNIEGQTFPTSLDLFDLIDADASNGGTWVQVGTGSMITITGGSMISSDGVTVFGETLTFEYTGGDTGGPCPPDVIEVTVSIEDCNCPVITFEPITLCNDGAPFDLLTILNNPSGLSGTWSTTSAATITGSMFDPSGLSAGPYDVTFTLDTDPGNNCPLDYTGEVLINGSPELGPDTGDQPCSMNTGNGLTTVNLYDWITTNMSGTWMQTSGDPMLPIVDDGVVAEVDFMNQDVDEVFTFVFTTNNAVLPCVDDDITVTIIVSDCNCPPVMLSDPAPICNDAGSVDLCGLIGGSDPGTFAVFDDSGADQSGNIDGTGCIFNAMDLDPGPYTIIYTLDESVTGICPQADTVIVNVSEYESVEISDPIEICSDSTGMGIYILNFNALISPVLGLGSWSDDDNSMVILGDANLELAVSFANVPAGDYNFTYTIDNDDPCPNFTHTITVTVVAICDCPPINPLPPEDVCSTAGPVDLTKYDDAMNPGTWSSTDLTVENGNSLITDGLASGTYTLTYTISNVLPDCPESTDVTIFIGEPSNAGVQDDPYRLCEDVIEVVSLFGLLRDADGGGTWTETSATLSSGFSDMDGTLTTGTDVAGTYTFEYSITTTDPCPPVNSIVTVVLEEKPLSDAGSEKFIDCLNPMATIGGTNSTVGTDIVYSWVIEDTGEEVGTTAMIDVPNGGTYMLIVTNTVTGCEDRSSVLVTKSDELPSMEVEPIHVTCFEFDDGSVILTNQTGGDGDYTYSLNDGETETSDPNAFTNLPADDYTIVIIDGTGCASDPYSFTITQPDEVTVEAGPPVITIESGETIDLSIEPFDTSTVTSIIWSISETTEVICSGLECTTISVSPTEVTNYYVEVMNANGCTAFDEVQVQPQIVVDVVFPNIITPNGDNNNDNFYIKSADVETVISMKIFDRWGEKLFDLGNFPPRDPEFGWDGKFKGKKVVPGVYVFTVEVLFINGDTKTISGDVTVTDSE